MIDYNIVETAGGHVYLETLDGRWIATFRDNDTATSFVRAITFTRKTLTALQLLGVDSHEMQQPELHDRDF